MGMGKEEAINIIKNMSDVEEESINISMTDRKFMQEVINWSFKEIEENGNLIINDDQVSHFVFIPNSRISLSKLIDLYGNPSSVIILKGKLDGVYTLVYVLFDQGICLEYQPSLLPFYDPNTYLIKKTDRIMKINYLDTSIQDWQYERCLTGLGKEDYFRFAQKWYGYERYMVNTMP